MLTPLLRRPAGRTTLPVRLLILGLAVALVGTLPAAANAGKRPGKVKVMSRNVYLGASLTPGLEAGSLQELVNAAGVILDEVDRNSFGVRAQGLAQEIRRRNPHLVGLQEAALWRTQSCTASPIPPSASDVRYDYVDLLLEELNEDRPKRKRYKVVVSQDEFDFEIYVNADGDESTSAPGCQFGSEFNGRLTMRDVILKRRGGVRTRRARSDSFETLLRVTPAGVPVDVTRGWTAVDAKVRGFKRFRFVNTHLEAFDNTDSNGRNNGDPVGNGEIREAQANELFANGGPADSRRPVIMLGDFNSDTATPIRPGDELAFQALLDAGFEEVGAAQPFSCCVETSLLDVAAGGDVSDFDHNVDHILTDTPNKIRLLRGAVTGRAPQNGFWNSDHAGLISKLRLGNRRR
jgi:endonuclease/exonuclease/phosphatase family metal-dependent hydrolase